jgi:hypothetical protein
MGLSHTLRTLYHIARADFLERIRRYSFLIMLGLVLWMAYLSASGQFRMRVVPNYLGVINSAWAGATMTITVSLLLGLFGFYLVKGSIQRDYATGVGQIMATTPLRRPVYTLGKWISNFAVLGIMVLLMLLAGIGMNLLANTQGFNLWALSAPLVLIALPTMALVAALAVLFESIPWLRGGFGNVVYFFAFLIALTVSIEASMTGRADIPANPWVDFTGWQMVGRSVVQAARAVYPENSGIFSFAMSDWSNAAYFTWNGLQWTGDMLLSRLVFLSLAVGIGLLAALFFDRFNPSRPLPVRSRKNAPGAAPEPDQGNAGTPKADRPQEVHLTSSGNARAGLNFRALFMMEMKLLLKGQRWWWYTIAAGLILAPLFTDLEGARNLLIAAWVWPVLMISGLGCRENQFDTRQIVFSAPHPVRSQLPAMWLSACAALALLGLGALARFVAAGEIFSILGWLTAVIFIPSLALALGVLTGSSKAFEVIYVVWMYLLFQRPASLDFAGLTPNSPLYVYAPLAAALIVIAVIARNQQVNSL